MVSHLSLKTPELEDVYDDGVSLRWNRVDVPAFDGDEEPLSFMVEAQHLPSYEWEPLARGITDNNYRVHGLQPQQDYVFRVRGELSSGITVPSSPVPLYRRPGKYCMMIVSSNLLLGFYSLENEIFVVNNSFQ